MPRKRTNFKHIEPLRNTPPLYHTLPGQPFDAENSEVFQWILKQPGVLFTMAQTVFNDAKARGIIWYDDKTRQWVGIAYPERSGNDSKEKR